MIDKKLTELKTARQFAGVFNPRLSPEQAAQPSISGFSMHAQGLRFTSTARIATHDHLHICVIDPITQLEHPEWDLNEFKDNQELMVAKLYRRHNKDLVKYLDGWFLIILFDEDTGELLLLNNPYLNSRCYCWSGAAGQFCFAHNLKALLPLLPASPDLDKLSLLNFLNSGYNHTEKTCFKDIFKLPPGYLLSLKPSGMSLERYYQPAFKRASGIEVNAALEQYEHTFLDTMGAFIRGNHSGEIGVPLSGGRDTSWIYYLASKLHDKPVHAFTTYYNMPMFDETERAGFVVKKFNGKHHTILCDERDFDLLPEVLSIAEEPLLSLSVAIYKLIKQAGQIIDLLVSGDGGDNIYGQYYAFAEFHRYIRYLPFGARKALHGLFASLAGLTGIEKFSKAEQITMMYAFESDYFKAYYEHLTSYKAFRRDMRQELLNPEIFPDNRLHEPYDPVEVADRSIFDDLIHMNVTYGLKPYMIFAQDKMAAAAELKFYAPFMDKKVVAFINALPQEYLVYGSPLDRLMLNPKCDRLFHRLALERVFPKEHVHGKKIGYFQPYHSWFKARPSVISALSKALNRRGWFNPVYLQRLFEEHKHQNLPPNEFFALQNHGYRIFALLAVEVWARLFLDGKYSASGLGYIPLEDFLA